MYILKYVKYFIRQDGFKSFSIEHLYVVEMEHYIYLKRHLALGATQVSKYNMKVCFERVK